MVLNIKKVLTLNSRRLKIKKKSIFPTFPGICFGGSKYAKNRGENLI